MTAFIKICGLNSAAAVEAARAAGATHAGFMIFEKSPRHVSLDAARALGGQTGVMRRVAVMVDPGDALVDAVVAALNPHMLQLHGRETPERVAEVKTRTGLQIIKALPVAATADVAASAVHGAADLFLFDAKPPSDADRPGGHGVTFDWSVLSGAALPPGWMLSGGLSAANVAEAIRATRAPGVDVSSGVEDAPGVKSPQRIAAFTAAARAAYGLPALDTAA